MSGGSSDDAVLAIGYTDADGRAVLARVLNQGPPPPFDPRQAVERFVSVLKEYGCASVTGDKYAGETFKADFERAGIIYRLADRTKSQLYEALEPALNGHRVVLLNEHELESQLLGLIWRGGKIDHPNGERDDWSNAVAGCVNELLGSARSFLCSVCRDVSCPGLHGGGEALDDESLEACGKRADAALRERVLRTRCVFPGEA